MSATTTQHTADPTPLNLGNDASFSIDFVSLGLIAAAIGWGIKVWFAHENRIKDLENKHEQNADDIEKNRCDFVASQRGLEAKFEIVSGLKTELEAIKQQIMFLTKSVERELDARNQTITESKDRIKNLEFGLAKLSENINFLVNKLAADSPLVFGRRRHDQDNPPSNPSHYP